MKSQLLSIFNFSSWYGQKNCIKTKYIYIKIFYYQKKKRNIRYVPEMGTFNYAKKIHVCNINQFYWPVMMHERPTQDTWANLVVKSSTTRLNPAKCPLLKSVPTLGSVSITGSRDVPPPDKLPWDVNRLGRPIVTSQRTVVQNTEVFFVQRSIVSCFEHKVLKLQVQCTTGQA